MKPFDTNGRFRADDKIEGLRLEAIRGAGANIAGAAASFILQMGSVVILARLLTPADFGIVTMVTTFSFLFCNFGLNGFTELILQRDDLDHFLASNLFWINVGIAAILTLVFAGLGHVLARFYHNPAVAAVAVGMSLTIIVGSLGWIHLALLNRARYFKASAIINLVSFLALAIVSISAALAGWHYWALVAGNIAQGVTKVICAWWVCRWSPSAPRRSSDTGSSLKFAVNVYAHFAFSYSTRNTDNLLVGWRFGASALGFYKKAYDLFVLSRIPAACSALIRGGQHPQPLERRSRTIPSLLFAWYLRARLAGHGHWMDFTLVGQDIIRLLLGPGWDEAGKIFSIFGLGIGVMLLYNAHGWIHLSIGKPERWFIWGLMEFVCTASLFLLMLRWGPVGIAFAWTASFFLLLFPGFWYAGKPINLPVSAVIAEVWKFFLASVLAGLSTALIARVTPMLAGAPGGLGAFANHFRFIHILGAFICCSLRRCMVEPNPSWIPSESS